MILLIQVKNDQSIFGLAPHEEDYDAEREDKSLHLYTYTRVSTAMQVDGYSLDTRKARMKAYADYNDYEIVGEYEDAGKSGKSIEGRAQFSQMMEDIKSGKDGIDSSKDAGKLMLSVLSAVAEIERGETMVLLSKL